MSDLTIEALVDGHPVALDAPAAPCEHRSFVTQDLVARITASPDGTGPVLRHQVKVKVRCAECGAPAIFDASTAAPSALDGSYGLVADFRLES